MLARIDSKGRLYIPKRMRKGLGREVYLVRVDNRIIIIPKPRDPLKTLEKLGDKIPEVSLEELKREIMRQAEEEVR